MVLGSLCQQRGTYVYAVMLACVCMSVAVTQVCLGTLYGNSIGESWDESQTWYVQ